MTEQRSSRPFPLVPVALLSLVLIGLVAFLFGRGDDGDKNQTKVGTTGGASSELNETQTVGIVGELLPPYTGESGGTDDAVGLLIPEVTGASFDGEPVAIKQDGKPKVLMFLAHWCPHCQKEVPVITDWIKSKGSPEGVELISVSTGTFKERPNYPPSKWLEREGWQLPVLADDSEGTTARAYGLSAFPFFVAVDADGKVVARASGELTIEQLEDLVTKARG